MNKVKLIFADNLHFHERNFRSLFQFIKQNSIEHTFMQPPKSMLTAFGNYNGFRSELVKYKFDLENLASHELMLYDYRGINVFNLCKSELISFLLPLKNWRQGRVSNTSIVIIEKAYSEDYEDLILNMSSAMFWIDFWHKELGRYRIHDYCCIFSGSNTYSKALIEVLKTHMTDPIIMESFFTGNEYYMEVKYDSLPNNSDLKFKNVFDSYKLPESGYEYNRLKAKAINKIITAKNKNVIQPSIDISKSIQLPEDYILIGGQVLNDYSIINTQQELNSIEKYKEIINILLKNTTSVVVFKAHPWEEKKNNIMNALTFKELNGYRDGLPKKDRDRLFIFNDINLGKLISNASGFVTICSQSAFEAAFNGLKPITIGGAFFDNFGFTSSFASCEIFETALQNREINFSLTLTEFEYFEQYLIVALCFHLVCVHKSGFIRLRELLSKSIPIEILHSERNKSIVVDNSISKTQQVPQQVSNVKETVTLSKVNHSTETKAGNRNFKNNNSKKESRLSETIIKAEDVLIKNMASTRFYKKYKSGRKVFFKDVENPLVKKYWKIIGDKL